VPEQTRFTLDESQIPSAWYNIIPSLPAPPPPALDPGTLQPIALDDLAPLFPMELIRQGNTGDGYVDIPGPVMDAYRLWRPTPLYRARRLEKLLSTPARIYYKYEGASPSGGHDGNTAVPQAYYYSVEGTTRLTTETGGGQWGSSLAFASARYGMDCEIWMPHASYDQKPQRRTLMQTWGATVHSSPSRATQAGIKMLADRPESPGSRGLAMSEAVEAAAGRAGTRYVPGAVLNHVLLHHTVIGQEAMKQLELAGEEASPDLIIGCAGGGTSLSGLFFPFLKEKLEGRGNPVIRAVEQSSTPSYTRGSYAYDFGDTAGLTPLLKMHTLGHNFMPAPVHAGELRYHGTAPLLSHIYELGLFETITKTQRESFAAAVTFVQAEGILPAPEPAFALASLIEEARRCAETGEEKVILTAVCGHGHFDMDGYNSHLAGELEDHDVSQERIDNSLGCLPVVP
jgi:tryptophan synthase beta chain